VMKQLVNSWIEAELRGYGNTLACAIKELSQECGIKLTHSRVAEWRKGKYTPSPNVIAYMLYKVYPWALVKVGITATESQLDALEDLVLNMKLVDGDRHLDLVERTTCTGKITAAPTSEQESNRHGQI
jgi:hypothetical protein